MTITENWEFGRGRTSAQKEKRIEKEEEKKVTARISRKETLMQLKDRKEKAIRRNFLVGEDISGRHHSNSGGTSTEKNTRDNKVPRYWMGNRERLSYSTNNTRLDNEATHVREDYMDGMLTQEATIRVKEHMQQAIKST